MKAITQNQPAPGDYYGLVYKGGFIVPILVVVLAVTLWWFLKKRRKTK